MSIGHLCKASKKHEQEGAQHTALKRANIEGGGGLGHVVVPHGLRLVSQENQHPVAEGGARAKAELFLDQGLRDHGVKGRCEVHEEQADIRVPALHVGEGCVHHRGNGIEQFFLYTYWYWSTMMLIAFLM